MNCNDVKQHLMAFHDGELEPALAAEVEAALAGCPECAAELEELNLVHAFAADAFAATMPEPDFSGLYDAVMARVVAEEVETAQAIEGVRVQREEARPGLLDRLGAWFGELFRFERPLIAMVGVAALVAIAAGFWFTGSASNSSGSGVGPAPVAKIENPNKRRGREGEVTVRSAWVEDSIATVGEVKVINFDDSDDQPLVLWHVVEGEGVALPATDATTPGKGL